ncbi:hypothetical protein L9F63_013539, partial [Diploptera punctata]
LKKYQQLLAQHNIPCLTADIINNRPTHIGTSRIKGSRLQTGPFSPLPRHP